MASGTSDLVVLDLLLRARYAGNQAFRAMSGDIEGLVNSTSGLEKVGKAMQALGDTMIAASVGAGLFWGSAIKQASDYEQLLNRLVATHAVAGDQLQSISQTIQSISTQYGIKSTDIASGTYPAFSALSSIAPNATLAQKQQLLRDLAAYVTASGMGGVGSVTFSQAAQDIPHVLAALHVPLSQWGNAMGALNAIENRAGLTQSQMVQSILRSAPILSASGISYNDLFAATGATASLGLVGARSGTEIGRAVENMMTNSAAQKELATLGINPANFYQKNGKLVDLSTIIATVTAKTAGLSPVDRTAALHKLFGGVGERAMNQLIQGQDKYNLLLGYTKGNTHAGMLQTAQMMSSSFAGSILKFRSAWQNLQIALGSDVLPALAPIVDRVTAAFERLTATIEKMNPQQIRQAFVGSTVGLFGGGVAMKYGGNIVEMIGRHRRLAAEAAAAAEKKAGSLGPEDQALADFQKLTAATGGPARPGFFSRLLPWNKGKTAAADFADLNNAISSPGTASAVEKELSKNPLIRLFQQGQRAPGKGAGLLGRLLTGKQGAVAQDMENLVAQATGAKPHTLSLYERLFPWSASEVAKAKSALPEGENLLERMNVGSMKMLHPFMEMGMNTYSMLRRGGGKIGGFLARQFPTTAKWATMEGANVGEKGLGMFGGLAGDLGKKVGGLVTGGFGKFIDLMKGLPGLLLKGAAALPGLIAGFAEVAIPVALVVGGIVALVLAFTRYRTETMATVHFIANQLAPIFNFFKMVVLDVVHTLQEQWNRVAPQVDAAMGQLLQAFRNATPVFQAFAIVIGAVIGTVLVIVGGLISGLMSALPHVIMIFSDIVNFVAGIFAIFGDLIHHNWKQLWVDFTNTIGDIGDAIRQVISIPISIIKGFFDFIVGLFGDGAKRAVDNFINGVLFKIPLLGGVLNAIGSGISDILGDGNSDPKKGPLKNTKKAGAHVVKSFASGMNSQKPQLVLQTQSMYQDMQNAINNMQTEQQMYQDGQKIVQGFINGVRSMDAYLSSTMSQVASNVNWTVKNALQIRSPSRVFHDIGQMTMQGYIEGVTSMNRAVTSTMQGAFPVGFGDRQQLSMSVVLDSLSVDTLHVNNVNGLQTGQQQNPTDTYMQTRAIQAQRESLMQQYQANSYLDSAYRYAYQYTA